MPGIAAEVQVIFAEELRRSIFRKAYLVLTVAVPALLAFMLIVIPIMRAVAEDKAKEEPKPIGVVNLSKGLNLDVAGFSNVILLSSTEDGIESLTRRDVKELFVVPADYLATGELEWLHRTGGAFSGFNPGPGRESVAIIHALLRIGLAGDNLPPEVLMRAMAPAIFDATRVGETGQPIEEDADAFGKFIVPLVLAILLLLSITMGASSLVQTVAEEKENRMIEVLLTSARPLSVLTGKVVAVGLAGLLQTSIWAASVVLVGPVIFNAIPAAPDIPIRFGVLLWAVSFFLGGYFVSAVIMAGVGATVPGVKEASQLAGIVVMPLIVPIYAMVAILSEPDGPFARVLSFIPFTAPTTMIVRLGAGDPPATELSASLLIIVATGAALLWGVARIFRAGLLLYGQRMGLRRMIAALREAG